MKRELSSYFSSPVAYVFLVIFLLLTGFFTFTAGNFFERGEASLAAFFGWHPWLYLVLVPAVGMRLWAEERRSGTLELLLTMPVAPWQAIVAKFLASWLFLALALALTFPAVVTVNVSEFTYSLSEGSTGAFWDEDVTLGNPADVAAPVRLDFLQEGAAPVSHTTTVAATPTVMNAILDALASLGVTDVLMPATPERIWRALRGHA